MQVNNNNIQPEGASQLVLGEWPLLEQLAVSFFALHEQLFKTIIEGDWPILKELNISTSFADPMHDWSKQQIPGWQTVEPKCRKMCISTWPDLRVLSLPPAPLL